MITHLPAMLPSDVPATLGRDEARRLAEVELAKPEYRHDQGSYVQRAITWLWDKITTLLNGVHATSPGKWLVILGLAIVVVLVVVAVRWRVGPRRRTTRTTAVFDPGTKSAEAYRADAERFAEAGAWAEAVRARLRALVRDLEGRGLVDTRPGRTAHEIAEDWGAALPADDGPLRDGARYFDDVWFGGRAADAAGYRRMVKLDDDVRDAAPGGERHRRSVLAVPR